ncbi:MAG: hypothetical protein JXA75_03180 [Candidatus Thermoplasmatota archaeon]|nr:hypothetical protein [Candidatus Thermoplasmatota archaeon]
MPLISEIDNLQYNTPPPLFEDKIKEIILHQIPGIADDYDLDTQQTIQRFKNIHYQFTGASNIDADANADDGAILLLSCGKDSLLTLGFARELDFDITPIFINDTTTPFENSVSLEILKKIAKEQDIHIEIVTNNIEKLNDFEEWNKPPSCLGYAHMITGFCFLALPFLHNNASMVLLGNQQNMNFSFRTKQEYVGYGSYDQTTTARHEQQKMLKYFNDQFQIHSLVEPLTDIAEMKILFSRYSELAKYQFSCNCLYGSDEKRWCHTCNKCARLSIFMHAHGIDVKTVGMNNMLSRQFMKYYVLFGMNPSIDRYDKSPEARDQQLLAFYLAYKNGVKGPLIDVFKRNFLSEAITREDELRKKFFRIYKTDLPNNIQKKLHAILKEELKDLQ